MSRLERRMADQPSVAVEQDDLNLDRFAGHNRSRCLPAGTRHRIAERDAVFSSMRERLRSSIGGENASGERGRCAFLFGKLGKQGEIDGTALRMEIEQALCELGQLAD